MSIDRMFNPQKYYFFQKIHFFTLEPSRKSIYIYPAFLGAPVPRNFTH